MPEEQYFYITCNDDGDIRVDVVDPRVLLNEINEGEIPAEDFNTFVTDVDPNMWTKGRLLIKGRIVTPQPLERPIKYMLE